MNLRNEFVVANPNNRHPSSSDLTTFLEAKGLREAVNDDLVFSTIMARMNCETLNGA